ncbi:putrescine export ABC transporter permease SapB [Escherichia coli]|nr:putrescine export ABC transporter permease SapB [Escherichia coli]
MQRATRSPLTTIATELFCDDSAQQIVDMLVDECEKGNVTFRLRSEVLSVEKDDTGFTLELNGMTVGCEKLVIAEQLKEVFPATMELCILAFGFALIVGIPVGMIAGITRHKWQDNLINAIALLGFSIPVFWLALLLTLFCSLTLGWLPVSGRFDLLYEVKPITGFALIDAWLSDSSWRDEMIMSAIRHMILPVITLSVAPTTEVIRLMRISTIEVYDQNYVKAAATRGLSRFTILRRHVLHNALPPVIPRLGLQFSTMLTLAMITEMVFSWPGLGRWLINAIRQQDYAAISAGVMVCGSLVIIVNVISDILGAMANPLKHKEWYALR